MPFPIPKIQYKNISGTGDISSGSATLSDLLTTDGLEVGMFARATGIPVGTKIQTIDSGTQVTLDQNATATTSNLSVDFGFEIVFEYPPKEPKDAKRDAKENISTSQSGVRQVSTNYIEIIRDLQFAFVSQAIKELVDTFMETHALFYETFRYFDDGLSVDYVEYELNQAKYQPKKIAPKGIEIYSWEFDMDLRRVL